MEVFAPVCPHRTLTPNLSDPGAQGGLQLPACRAPAPGGRVAAAELRAGVAEVKEPCSLPMLSVDMENKENGSGGVKNSVENGRPPDPADWAVMDVVNYFRTAGFEEQASVFQEQGHPFSSELGCWCSCFFGFLDSF
ncbi:sterile alpha motif domain-containing protein 13 isoform X5 [Ochotona curzoniae]|uniref:sterile alpha motif domain-containing protein 13 isoform X5 n=1 Tax=Ochotona curzoniae TaxID=130825 RepID=UPI001B349865|nr:sterile alpha motif domain-containing protein 13 isoform X5 [Ochotona curzoniae]